MLLAVLALAVTVSQPQAADPVHAVESVDVLRADVDPPTVACHAARLSDGRVVAPLLPLAGVKRMEVRGRAGNPRPVVAVEIPQSIPLLILDLDPPGASPTSRPPAATPPPVPSCVGLKLVALPGANAEIALGPCRILIEDCRTGYRLFAADQAFPREHLGAVAANDETHEGGILVGDPLDVQPPRTFARLDPASLTVLERRSIAEWGEETSTPATLAAARALDAADAAALVTALGDPKDPEPTPIHHAVLVLAISELTRMGQYQAVADAFDARAELGRDQRVRALEGMAAWNLGKYESALILTSSMGTRTAVEEYVRASAFSMLKKPKEAEAAYRKALEKEPGLLPAWVGLGTVGIQGGHSADAARCAGECLKYDLSGASAAVIASQMEAAGMSIAAESVRRDVLALDPRRVEFIGALAFNLVYQQKWKEALAISDDSASKGQQSPLLLEAGLRAAGGLHDLDQIRPRVEAFLKVCRDARAFCTAAEQWYLAGRFDEAAKLLDPVAGQFDDSSRFCTRRAFVLANLKRFDEAVVSARRAMELDPKDELAVQYATQGEFERGELDKAQELAQRTLEQHPRDTTALEILIRIAHRRGDRDTLQSLRSRLGTIDWQQRDALDEALKNKK